MCSVIDVTAENYREYFMDLKYIYEMRFGVQLSLKDIEEFLIKKNSIIKLYYKGGKIIGYIRYRYVDPNYNVSKATGKSVPVKRVVALSDLASLEKGCGTTMVNDLLRDVHEFIVTVPWKNELIGYYKRFGFRASEPTSMEYPAIVMYLDNR